MYFLSGLRGAIRMSYHNNNQHQQFDEEKKNFEQNKSTVATHAIQSES